MNLIWDSKKHIMKYMKMEMKNMKPIIALCSRDGIMYKSDAYFVQQNYMNAIEEAGAHYIAAVPNKAQDYEYLVNMCDGLLICGGADSNPKYYNQELHETDSLVKENIDEMDLKLLDLFIKAKKPVLGICRGHQIINIYYGGTLIQDIPSLYETSIHHRQEEPRNVGTHTVTLSKDSILGKKGEIHSVNTFHHQNIDKVGDTLEVVAYSEDGLVEAICNDAVVGVQWHPECMIHDDFHMNIIQTFVDKCKE